jgi:hypothetical protein
VFSHAPQSAAAPALRGNREAFSLRTICVDFRSDRG